ncbi:MAG: hypothetical protein AAGJ83_11910, partial [Planctomycetota bacterium]
WEKQDESLRNQDDKLLKIPEFYRLDSNRNTWEAIAETEVPTETGLADAKFERFQRPPTDPYVTPDDPQSDWKSPGPVAGPFYAYPGDGSKVTYYWYRFADQPSMLNADLTDAQREVVQQRVELLHRHWKRDQEYLPPPRIGGLASVDPALIVDPPKGLGIGYVPIVTRQESIDSP